MGDIASLKLVILNYISYAGKNNWATLPVPVITVPFYSMTNSVRLNNISINIFENLKRLHQLVLEILTLRKLKKHGILHNKLQLYLQMHQYVKLPRNKYGPSKICIITYCTHCTTLINLL